MVERCRETNLKVRQSLPETAEIEDDIRRLAAFNAEIIAEAPNNRLSKFEGTMKWNNKTYALDNDKMILRGLQSKFLMHFLVRFDGWRKQTMDILPPALNISLPLC